MAEIIYRDWPELSKTFDSMSNAEKICSRVEYRASETDKYFFQIPGVIQDLKESGIFSAILGDKNPKSVNQTFKEVCIEKNFGDEPLFVVEIIKSLDGTRRVSYWGKTDSTDRPYYWNITPVTKKQAEEILPSLEGEIKLVPFLKFIGLE